MGPLLQDFRYALRMLRKNLGLTIVIVLSLAIGIGANSAIFSIVDALLLRPLPYPQPERLAAIWLHSPGIGIFRDWPSPGQYVDIRRENHSFEEMAIARSGGLTLTGFDQPEPVAVMRTSSSLLHMLGAKPLLGRLLLPDEDKPGKSQVAIVSAGLWRRRFNSGRRIVGKPITLNGRQYTVAGVLRPDFLLNSEVMPSEGPMDKVDIILPLPLGANAEQQRGDENYNILARLKPGVSVRQAQADIDVIAARIREKDKRDRTFGMTVIGLQDQVVGDVRRALLVLFGSVALVLLIACVNITNLQLTRAAARQKEVAIRAALGADSRRLVRQLLTESVLLALMAGMVAVLIAAWSLYIVRLMNPGNIPRLENVGIDGSVLAFTFGVSVVVGILFGLAPAWRAAGTDLNTSLKSGGRTGQGDGGMQRIRYRLRGLLVISEFAFSLMLLAGAGLLIRSFVRLQNIPPGFTTDHVLSMRVNATGMKYRRQEAVAQLYRAISDRLVHLPGVKAEGAVSALPLTGTVGWGEIAVEGYHPAPGQELQVDFRIASADYFRAMEIPLIQGRFFSPHDTSGAQKAAIIDQKFAQRFWPQGDAIGKHVWFDHPENPFTIVGVVGVVKQYGLDNEGKIAVYFSDGQQVSNGMYLVARTSSDPAALAGPIVHEIHAIDPNAVVFEIRTMRQRLYDSLARQRFATTMLGAFAAFALLLAAVGVYGVISYVVSQSRRNIGIRIALGSPPGSIAGLVIRQGMELAGIGIVAGLLGAAALTRLMAGLLFGVTATDTLTFSIAVAILAAAAFLATAIPAFRATRVDPIVVLSEE